MEPLASEDEDRNLSDMSVIVRSTSSCQVDAGMRRAHPSRPAVMVAPIGGGHQMERTVIVAGVDCRVVVAHRLYCLGPTIVAKYGVGNPIGKVGEVQ
jgi:hypothetical protein